MFIEVLFVLCRTPYTSYSVGGKNAYCLPFPGADRSVVTRSQRLMYEEEKKAPVQTRNYFTVRYVHNHQGLNNKSPISNFDIFSVLFWEL